MPPDELEALAKLAHEAWRAAMSSGAFRPWEHLHPLEREAVRASVRAVLAARGG